MAHANMTNQTGHDLYLKLAEGWDCIADSNVIKTGEVTSLGSSPSLYAYSLDTNFDSGTSVRIYFESLQDSNFKALAFVEGSGVPIEIIQ